MEWAVLVLRVDSDDSVLLVVCTALELCVDANDVGMVVIVLVA